MTINHYNGATIWGVLEKYKRKYTEHDKPYLEMYVNCNHPEYGNVRILGRIWGENQVNNFTGRFKAGDEIRLEGNLQQYESPAERGSPAKRGEVPNNTIRSAFNFYKFNNGPLKERKAAFRLTGEVVGLEGETLNILCVHRLDDGNIDREEIFEVRLPHDILLDAERTPEPGQTVRIKGYIMQQEDDFGDAIGPQCPVVKKLEILDN